MGNRLLIIRFVIASIVLGLLLFVYVFLSLPRSTLPLATGDYEALAWSPEGSYVAYTSVGDMQGNKLYIDRVGKLGLDLPTFQDRVEDQ